MSFIVNEPVEKYAEEHTTRSGPLQRLADETREKSDAPQMMAGCSRAASRVPRPADEGERILELGTFTGWSSVSMAMGLTEGGRVTTCDVNEGTTAIARRYAEEAGVVDRIEYRLGPGLETIASLDGPFDLIFMTRTRRTTSTTTRPFSRNSRTTASSSPTTCSGPDESPSRRTRTETLRRSAPSTTTCWPTTASYA